jgi:hypothetical protein
VTRMAVKTNLMRMTLVRMMGHLSTLPTNEGKKRQNPEAETKGGVQESE